MRRKRCQIFLVIAIVINLLALFYAVRQQQSLNGLPNGRSLDGDAGKGKPNYERRHIDKKARRLSLSQRVTVVFREYEDFDNLIPKSVESILRTFSRLNILIVADSQPYPPLKLPTESRETVQLVTLAAEPDQPPSHSNPERFINTEYVLFLPDGVILTPYVLEKMIDKFESINFIDNKIRLIAVKIVNRNSDELQHSCFSLKVNLQKWMTQSDYIMTSNICDSVSGSHAVLIRSSDLHNLSYPYTRPISQSLYLQTSLRKWKIFLMSDCNLDSLGNLYNDAHVQWKHQNREEERKVSLYSAFGIKKVINPDGHIGWYGCSKETVRCFGTVINSMPEYLYRNRWTPPCCIRNLRETVKHVFEILDNAGVRYWLEGGSLLGAARNGDIIPWDYDVDIGIYRDDFRKCHQLKNVRNGVPFTDAEGFVWEKATEGDFYRVQYSNINHVHVDVYPFYSKNGIMTKDTWMKSHRQDTEFPEHFLQPLTRIEFAGLQASAPNHVKEFLEFKFGSGVIENPQYPDPKILVPRN
ncbi:ribitol 5-phosphate transferase FKRP-like [Saccoglossus kowalevskii]|uniref:Fukutin-related protein-like n=1 Tax=Saccoglossus kowalevskii TaxID=10224 RepID=A0ABM0GP76_SACKO|nr:PREDICTED: fukutin-related protein-like [Saccoglossus kowalevskii]